MDFSGVCVFQQDSVILKTVMLSDAKTLKLLIVNVHLYERHTSRPICLHLRESRMG